VTNQRNMILAIVLTGLLLFGWDAVVRYFYPHAERQPPVAEQTAQAPSADPSAPAGSMTPVDQVGQPAGPVDLAAALAAPDRVPIAAPGLSGSINLTGGVVDDLTINRHTATVDEDSGPARIFSPRGTPAQQFAQFGWVAGASGDQRLDLPTVATEWTVPEGARLTPQNPVTLTWTNSTGQTFAIRYAIDSDYMITAAASMANRGDAPVAVRPFALLNRTDKTAALDGWNIHSGPFGAFDGTVSFGPDYDDLSEAGAIDNSGRTDWIGFTDIYWMATLIPGEGKTTSAFRTLSDHIYRADVVYEPQIVAPGGTLTRTTRLFAGAKESPVLDRYEEAGIANFGLAIDWGWFRWFEKPIFWLLNWLFQLVGNFGVAIILLTVIVRALMFPIAQRQFASMAQMRAVQPKMKALQERYKDDKAKLQEETMKLYRDEKVNPLAGCLPIFLQIPVFFALYKVLMVSVEMRHQPFVLWIEDLSAPDPAHILNLFGLLPYEVPGFLAIGVLAVLLGITMWLQFKLNPAPMDPVQQQVFAIMPWMMMFIMAPFAAGLLVYWITSNVLTIAQQAYLYSRHPQLKAQAEQAAADAKRSEAKAK
jgi:YidC/Oxa1 family membrane protein insertase